MSPILDRVYHLSVGDNSETLELDGFVGDPARVQFRIDRGYGSYDSHALITVFGLGRQSRQKIYERYDRVRFTAGYRDSWGQLFSGTIYNVSIGRDGPETFVTLFCRASGVNWDNAQVVKTFGAGTNMLEVVTEVAESFGLPVEFVGDFSDLPTLASSMPVQQSANTFLATEAKNFGFTWTIDGGRLTIFRDGAKRETMHSTSALTGMVGTPIITQWGIEVTTRLMNQVQILDQIEVRNETGQLNFANPNAIHRADTIGAGIYRISGLTHDGDLYGDNWSTTLQGLNPRTTTTR
ncbi:baseplate hub protein [Halomonas salifodinae]|uniref:Baseplate hub protein n=1 Tax=Halomonas salifodinae TaxID=438745 RepID=A0ABW2EZA3_9GAMM